MKRPPNRLAAWVLAFLVLAATARGQLVAPPPTAAAVVQAVRPTVFHSAPYDVFADRELLLDHCFARLRDMPYDYKKVGSLVEAMAFLGLQKTFPSPRYEVIPNLEYQDGDRTVGEVDLVVFDREANQALLAIEVKLSKNLKRAGRRASRQLHRFQLYLDEGKIDRFIDNRNRGRTLEPRHFEHGLAYARVANQGALAAGYDYEVDLTREEADVLQERLLATRLEFTP